MVNSRTKLSAGLPMVVADCWKQHTVRNLNSPASAKAWENIMHSTKKIENTRKLTGPKDYLLAEVRFSGDDIRCGSILVHKTFNRIINVLAI